MAKISNRKMNSTTVSAATQAMAADKTIYVKNSLSRDGNTPLLKDPNQRELNWYICGPTVYAPSHLGHARTYVAFDTIRRVLTDYFGFHVNYCMNITDVDDKIIKRTRENWFRADFQKKNASNRTAVVARIEKAFDEAIAISKAKVAEKEEELNDAKETHKKDLLTALSEQTQKHKLVVDNWTATKKIIDNEDSKVDELMDVGGGVLAECLDRELADSTPFTNEQFRHHAEGFEIEYFDDMRAMNVRDPDVITRVTEYVPHIIQYVSKIIENGDGYVAKPDASGNSSVYFDVAHFGENHTYAQLKPEAEGNEAALQEGEGSLAQKTSEKRNNVDFALWKASKTGEPSWDSPWGKGRPGWHIECSAMATDVLGIDLDIHSGGEDLKFPHHTNECAQAESYFSNPNSEYYHQRWCRVWLHSGHLHINGCKMSKSLKNFITIRTMLGVFSMEQIRLMFLLQTWNAQMNVDWENEEGTVAEAKSKEVQFREFFLTVRALERDLSQLPSLCSDHQQWDEHDQKLNKVVIEAMNNVDDALRDSFNFPLAVRALSQMVTMANKYFLVKQKVHAKPKILLLKKIASYLNRILACLGVVRDDQKHFLGERHFQLESKLGSLLDIISRYRDMVRKISTSGEGSLEDSTEEFIQELSALPGCKVESTTPLQTSLDYSDDQHVRSTKKAILDIASAFVLKIREASEEKDQKKAKMIALTASDHLRDVELPSVGIKLEDPIGSDDHAIWKLFDPEYLHNLHKDQERSKLRSKIQDCKKQIGQLQDSKVSVREFFEREIEVTPEGVEVAKYSKFDNDGIPTHDSKGEEITAKSQKKKLKKLSRQQLKKYTGYQKKLEKDPNLEDNLLSTLAIYEAKLKELGDVGL